jgi:hypothetical protein
MIGPLTLRVAALALDTTCLKSERELLLRDVGTPPAHQSPTWYELQGFDRLTNVTEITLATAAARIKECSPPPEMIIEVQTGIRRLIEGNWRNVLREVRDQKALARELRGTPHWEPMPMIFYASRKVRRRDEIVFALTTLFWAQAH